jgi:hypothetical protein
LSTIDGHTELVGLVVEGAGKLSRRLLSEWKNTLRKNVEVTTFLKLVQSSGLNRDLLCLSSCQGDKVILGESAREKTELDTLEWYLST